MARLILAPMEGLADVTLRDVLTRVAPYDWCVTEFVRVSATKLPLRHFTHRSPELKTGARTAAGTPVRVQLMGADPELMAINAAQAARLNPFGIDLNFGCPAPLVNRRRAGAALLEEPELLHRIVSAVRAAVPSAIPVTAKMRLGLRDTALALDCAQALASGGAAELVVHGRTQADGYRPPARWEWIAAINDHLPIPVIANGEVWTVADYQAIRNATGCDDVMLGRGAVADPLLARRIRHGEGEVDEARDWPEIVKLLAVFWPAVRARLEPRHTPGRLKQWLGLMRRQYEPAERLYRALRPINSATETDTLLRHQGIIEEHTAS